MATVLNRRMFLQGTAWGIGALTLAACAPAAPSTGGAAAPAPAAEGDAPVPALLRAGNGEEDYFNKVTDMFEKENPDVKINRIFAPGGDEYITKLDLMFAAGDPPAIYAPFSSRGYRYYAARGLSQELDDFVARDNFDLSVFHADGLKGCHWEGKLCALPLDLWPHMVFYNKTMFEEAGVEPLTTDWEDKSWTYDKYLETAKALTKKDGDTISQFGTTLPFADWPSGWLFGGDWWPLDTYETGIIAEFTGDQDERTMGAVQWSQDLMFKENVAPTPAQSQQLQVGVSTPFFMTGKVAMEMTNIGNLSQYATIKEFEWSVAPAPFPNDGSPRHLHVWIDFWSMIKGVKNLEGSWKYLKYMSSEEAHKIYPIEYGPQSAILSLADYWVSKQTALTNLDAAHMKVLTEAPKYEQIDPENWTVNMSEVYVQALRPALDRVWLGEDTVANIFAEATPDIKAKVEETKVIS